MSLDPILMLYNRRDWRPLGTLLEHSRDILCCHCYWKRCLTTSPKFLCSIEVSLRAELTNYLIVRCIIYHHSALHQLFYILSTSYNKSTYSTLAVFEVWFLNINSSVSTRVYTIFPAVTMRPFNAGVPDFDRHTRNTTPLCLVTELKCLYKIFTKFAAKFHTHTHARARCSSSSFIVTNLTNSLCTYSVRRM